MPHIPEPSAPIRVLHCVPSFYPATVYGGPIFSVLGLCKAVAMHDVDLEILTTDANGPTRLTPEQKLQGLATGLNISYCRHLFRPDISPGLIVKALTKIRHVDLLHITATYSVTTIQMMILANIFGKPVVFSPRGALQRFPGTSRRGAKAIWEAALRKLWRPGWSLHATAQNELEASLERLPAPRTCLIPNGVELPPTVFALSAHQPLRLLYVGRLHVKKGIEALINALALFSLDGNKHFSLRVVGAGNPEYVKTLHMLAAKNDLVERVSFLGHLDGVDLEAAYQWAHCVVVPSFVENFGMVVVEALARARPVIASRGTPWEEIEREGCGLWRDSTPESLRDAIKSLEAMDLLAMGDRGRQFVARRYTWEACGREMFDEYTTLCRKTS